jgi:hypothetical protein
VLHRTLTLVAPPPHSCQGASRSIDSADELAAAARSFAEEQAAAAASSEAFRAEDASATSVDVGVIADAASDSDIAGARDDSGRGLSAAELGEACAGGGGAQKGKAARFFKPKEAAGSKAAPAPAEQGAGGAPSLALGAARSPGWLTQFAVLVWREVSNAPVSKK